MNTLLKKNWKSKCAALTLAGLMLAGIAASANARWMMWGDNYDRGDRLEATDRVLQLTPEQQSKIRDIQKDEAAKLDALRDKDFGSRQERRDQMIAVRDASRDAIDKVLTPEQRTKLSAIEDYRRGDRRADNDRYDDDYYCYGPYGGGRGDGYRGGCGGWR